VQKKVDVTFEDNDQGANDATNVDQQLLFTDALFKKENTQNRRHKGYKRVQCARTQSRGNTPTL